MNIRRRKTKYTTDYFIERATRVHGYKYDYSNTVYVGSTMKVDIGCPEHGIFSQTPNSHLAGRGCPVCGKKLQKMSYEKTMHSRFMSGHATALFIERAVVVHGNKYDYNAVRIEGRKVKVAIICRRHGVFHQMPQNHLTGSGCPTCGAEKRKHSLKKRYMTTGDRVREFISKYIDSIMMYVGGKKE